jgi:nucleotide sugar dehydrogenase
MNVAVIGCGYVGTVSAACLASLGHEVVGVDVDESRVDRLDRGELPFIERGLPELVRRERHAGRLSFTADTRAAVADTRVVMISVATPATATGHADLSQLWRVADTIGPSLGSDAIVVTRSTVPVGTGDVLEARLRATSAWRGDVISNPEFLREGTAVEDFLHPDRVVLGGARRAALAVQQLYADVGAPVFHLDRRSAEMVKAGANAVLAAKISLANELADLCERTGADARTVLPAIGADARIGAAWLGPGLGWGGSCLPKDLAALIATGAATGHDTPLLRAVDDVNHDRVELALRKLGGRLGGLAGRRVALVGIAFKDGTDDIRCSTGLALAAQLLDAGTSVAASDQYVTQLPPRWRSVDLTDDAYAAATNADALVVTVASRVARTLDARTLATRMRGRVVFDAPNALDAEAFLDAGLDVIGTGWSADHIARSEAFLETVQG